MTPTTDAELLKGLRESFSKHSGKATFSVSNGDFERLLALAERHIKKPVKVEFYEGFVEEDGDEIFTPMPKHCTKFCCRHVRQKLVKRKGFMVCPRCETSYGKAKR